MLETSSAKTPALSPAPSRPEDWSFGLPVPSTGAQRVTLWVGTCAILLWSLGLRLYDLGGALNLDSVYFWFPWTDAFWRAVERGDWEKTYLAAHPGVLPMWLSGASMKLQGVLSSVSTPDNIVAFKLPIAAMNGVAPAAIFLVAAKRLGPTGLWLAFAMAALWASEPFMVSHGRLFYMDVPFASWSALAVWLCALALRTRRFGWCLGAGVALGLAAATRLLPALTVLAGIGIWFGAHFVASRGQDRRLVGLMLVLVVTMLAAFAALWPSFLINPLGTLERLYATTTSLVKQGHRTYFRGAVGGDIGVAFYMATLVVKTSPEVLVCSALGVFAALSRPALRPLSLGLAAAYFPYVAAILWSDKKIGRYLLDAYPVLLFFAAAGMLWVAGMLFRGHLRSRTAVALIAIAVLSLGSARTQRLATLTPHLAAWCADYPGLPCDRWIAFRPFIGLRETAQWIASEEPNRRPKVYVTHWGRGRRPHRNIMPWLDYVVVKKPEDAEYLVVINSIVLRGFRNPFVLEVVDKNEPAYRFNLGAREFVRVYRMGP